MCGIFGYRGLQANVTEMVRSALEQLEYRGYDSWGIATKHNGIHVQKKSGRIPSAVEKIESTMAIGHTRWATHGAVTTTNAHPHVSEDGSIVIVHNGIVENFLSLKEQYSLTLTSQTDSEIIAALTQFHMECGKSFVDACKQVLTEITGTYGIVAFHKDRDELFVARMGSPLVLGKAKGGYVVGSDITALLPHTKEMIVFEDGQYGVIDASLQLYELASGNKVTPTTMTVDWDAQAAQKEGYEHFMLKEIFEQPAALAKTLQGRIHNDLPHLQTELEGINTEEVKRIIILGCGTSWHAGIVGEFMLEGLARIPVEVEYASEFRYRSPVVDEGTLAIAISQSGETIDTLAALREAKEQGAKVLSICNVMGSTIARESDVVLYTRAGPEIGVASTKAFTTQVAVLYLLTAHFANERQTLSKAQVQDMMLDIQDLGTKMQSILDDHKEIAKIAQNYVEKKNALFLGRGVHYPIALEGALKLKEVSYIHAEGYPAAEMKHGPIALIDKDMSSVVIATKDIETYEKVLGNIQEVKARGGEIIAIATTGDEQVKQLVDNVVYVPRSRYSLSALLTNVPLQLFAYYVAKYRECDIDKPRNLAKSVTVE